MKNQHRKLKIFIKILLKENCMQQMQGLLKCVNWLKIHQEMLVLLLQMN